MAAIDDWRVDPAALPFAMLRVDAAGRITHYNSAATRLFDGELPDRVLTSCLLPGATLDAIVAHGGVADVAVRRIGGASVARMVSSGAPEHIVAFFEEPAASGSMLSQLNHRVAQPLMAAMGSLELMLLTDPLEPAQRVRVERAYEQIERACTLLAAAVSGGQA